MNRNQDKADDDLTALIARVLNVPVQDLDDESSPKSVHTWDSLRMLNLIIAVEETYGIKLDQNDLLRFSSVKQIRNIVNQHSSLK